MEPILYVNACVRSESRTNKLALKLLGRMNDSYEEMRLIDIEFPKVDEAYLNKRDHLIAQRDFKDPMFDLARRFSEVETIVIAAPFWDLSFPSILKRYLEQVCVRGLTFKYSMEGKLVGLCKAKRLFYITTAGGLMSPDTHGYDYVKALAQNMFGIQDVRKIEAVGLDIQGGDADKIIMEAENLISKMDLD